MMKTCCRPLASAMEQFHANLFYKGQCRQTKSRIIYGLSETESDTPKARTEICMVCLEDCDVKIMDQNEETSKIMCTCPYDACFSFRANGFT